MAADDFNEPATFTVHLHELLGGTGKNDAKITPNTLDELRRNKAKS